MAWSAAGALLAWPDTAMSTLPTFLPVFACGMAAAALAHRRVPSRGRWWALMVAGAALVCADAWWHHQGTGMTGHVVRDLPAALGFAALVAAVAAHPPAVLSRAPLRGLGTISYGLYLWHLPVLLWLRFEGLMPGGFVLPWLEVTALSALVAVRELGGRRAARDRGGRALAPVDAARAELPGRSTHQAGAERGVRRARGW